MIFEYVQRTKPEALDQMPLTGKGNLLEQSILATVVKRGDFVDKEEN